MDIIFLIHLELFKDLFYSKGSIIVKKVFKNIENYYI